MHVNLAEWCQDLFDWEHYPGGAVVDPQGPTTGSDRVIRGGGYWHVWFDWCPGAWRCRSASRNSYGPVSRNYNLGFRAVLAPGQ